MNKFTTLSNRDSSIVFKWDDEKQEMKVKARFIIYSKENPLDYIIESIEGMYDMYNKCKLLQQFSDRTIQDIIVILNHKIKYVDELHILFLFIDNGYIQLYEQAKEKWAVYIA
jgi:hypothetical protein